MKYLVCRMDGINGRIQSSDMWPMIVEITPEEYSRLHGQYKLAEFILFRAFDSKYPGYRGKHEYLIVGLGSAIVIGPEVPKPAYEVRNFV